MIHKTCSINSGHQGPVSLTVFTSQFKFDGNFVSLSPRLHYRDRYKILYMARQLCCRGMCKNLLRSDGQQRSYGKAKFPSYLNCGQKNVSETGPWPIYKNLQLILTKKNFHLIKYLLATFIFLLSFQSVLVRTGLGQIDVRRD